MGARASRGRANVFAGEAARRNEFPRLPGMPATRRVRILGVDPSLSTTGYGVVDCNGTAMRLVEGGVIVSARSKSLEQRLAELQRGLAEVILGLRPDVMVVEEVFSRMAYPRTAIIMAHARGALVCAAALEHMPVFNYSATAVKRALVGNGAASKEQVAAMVVQTLRLRRSPRPADVTDALALAIAHGRRSRSGSVGPSASNDRSSRRPDFLRRGRP